MESDQANYEVLEELGKSDGRLKGKVVEINKKIE